MPNITLQDRVLAHLDAYKHLDLEEERYVPAELTQDGIASALNVSRPHASQILSGMVEKGEIDYVSSYVNGASRPIKRKVYRLTFLGKQKYQAVREKLIEMGVDMDRIGINFNNCCTDEFRNLSAEERNMYGCLSVLRITVRREEIGRDLPLVVYDHNGILSLKNIAKKRFLETGSPEDLRNWHSMAADWVLDHGNDPHERLYHLNQARRDIESLKLIRKSRHQLFDSRVNESAMIVAEIGKRCNQPEIRRMAALLALECRDTKKAEKIIMQISEEDPNLGGAMMAELYLKTGHPEKAVELSQKCYRGDVDTGMALGKSLLASGHLLEA